ncbi:sperm-egg fusion protein TMEM95 isoform X1 [Dipodomys spectabilis]|uniref:sperm-egg fusion protein TMEM95 isoform X1 n=1 Tax=Dipodomys spectabilis TaxID=105255 RepID=UPI001C543DCA|nr:sperm-egg fusion protein TMEM95 isoform X1 [Dipodomys spectabilis]
MWVLALGGVFLAVGQACIFCRLPAHDLPGRLARITSGIDARWKDWAVPDFSAFALDELTMNKVTEKTHRVLRVIEIKGSLSSLLPYWQWLQKTKIPQYTREGLCAPACPHFPLSPAGGSTILYNCSTCEGTEAPCWPRKRCLPGSHDLWKARIVLSSIVGAALLLGGLSLQVEALYLRAKDDL